MKRTLLAASIVMIGITATAETTQKSKYSGQQVRKIKSLSPDDIKELKNGGGWGLAKAAELNGVPGPAHLLEMQDAVPLDAAQVAIITEIFKGMKSQAIEKGVQLIELERQLEEHFKNRTITDTILREYLANISKTRMELRYIHLATHLKTPEILTKVQIEKYNELRGYANSDPCANIPEGHNADMWRKHNGCEG